MRQPIVARVVTVTARSALPSFANDNQPAHQRWLWIAATVLTLGSVVGGGVYLYLS